MPSRVSLIDEVTFRIKLNVRLADDPLVLFPSGQVKRIRLKLSFLTAFLGDLFVCLLNSLKRNVLVRLELSVAAIVNLDVFDHAAIFNLSIRRFDKAVLVDACEARERRDESDVRTFRRLDRADASVVSRVHVANLESRTLTR